jgi:hypothetical protein
MAPFTKGGTLIHGVTAFVCPLRLRRPAREMALYGEFWLITSR